MGIYYDMLDCFNKYIWKLYDFLNRFRSGQFQSSDRLTHCHGSRSIMDPISGKKGFFRWAGRGLVNVLCCCVQNGGYINQSADSTAWTGFLNCVFQLLFMILCECYYQYYISCTNVRIHSFNVPFQGLFVSFPIPWIYSSSLLLWTAETVQHTSTQSIITFSALILAGDYETGWDSG